MIESLRKTFWAGGWLAVAALPLALLPGRAVFNVTGAAYLIWAGISLARTRVTVERPFFVLFGLMAAAYLPGILVAGNLPTGLKAWGTCLAFGAFSLVVHACLSRAAVERSKLVTAFGLVAFLAVILLYAQYAWKVHRPGFTPESGMYEDDLPFFAMFLLYWITHLRGVRHRGWLAAAMLGAIVAYIVISHGRAALFGLIVGLAVYAVFVVRWRAWRAAVAALIIVAAVVGIRGQGFLRGALHYHGWSEILAHATSQRSVLWQQAFRYPPENIWIGTGMANFVDQERALTVLSPAAQTIVQVKHFHNFLVDTWYSTGIAGLGALLLWLAFNLRRGFVNWLGASGPAQAEIGVLLAAASAILGNAMLSYSYTSKQFAIYGFVFLVAAATRSRNAAMPPG